MQTLYCLELVGGRFYVGQTPFGRFSRRYDEHFRRGAKWTTRFAPRRVLWTREVPKTDADYLEDRACCEIMREHGLNSCRGGTFNIGRDVRVMPKWAKPMYKAVEEDIMRRTKQYGLGTGH